MNRVSIHFILLWFSKCFIILNCQVQQNLQPNILVILIDDLDVALGGMEPMSITRRLFGATFTNAFVSTPVCCPSRSSLLTGKYVHNHRVINNTSSGNCSSRQWQSGEEQKTMATYLQANGYATFYGGKYLNQYGKNETGGVEHVPPGYNRWVGLVGNSRYYNYSLSVDGHRRDHGDDYHLDYLTDVLAREALDFIDGIVSVRPSHQSSLSGETDKSRPFFAVIAPPACHSPFTPAPQFSRKFAGRKAPRWPSFNRHPGDTKHWLMRQAPPGPLPREIVDKVDHVFRQRWRTLLSVDEMIGKLVKLLTRKGQMDRTWIVVTSDHGYHMGQFSMPIDKRLPYETDIRVPLLVLAPSNKKNNINDNIEIDSLSVVSIDLAPTVLDMAGVPIPNDMDGVSLLPLITDALTGSSRQPSKRVSAATDPWDSWIDKRPHQPWRSSFLIEYHGEADLEDVDHQCQQDPNTTLCLNDFGCKCQDSANNTYVCLRTLSLGQGEDSLYCQFDDSEKFVEFYDLLLDPYQLKNRAYRRSCRPTTVPSLDSHKRIVNYSKCRGYVNCFGG